MALGELYGFVVMNIIKSAIHYSIDTSTRVAPLEMSGCWKRQQRTSRWSLEDASARPPQSSTAKNSSCTESQYQCRDSSMSRHHGEAGQLGVTVARSDLYISHDISYIV